MEEKGKKAAWMREEENIRIDEKGNGGSAQKRVEMEGNEGIVCR